MTSNEARSYAREWLNRGRSLHNEIKTLKEYRETLTIELGGGVASYKIKEVQTDVVSAQARTDDLRIVYSETCDKIEKRIVELAKINNETLDVINKIDNPIERTILVGRHVSFKPWHKVIKEVNYSRANANRYYSASLDKIFMILYGNNPNFKTYVERGDGKKVGTQ